MSKTMNSQQPLNFDEPTIKKANLKAMEYVGWFNSDTRNVSNWCSQLFNNDVNLLSEKTIQLRQAAESAIAETEDDIANIKAFLAEYVPIEKK